MKKWFYELDKLENSECVINQKLRVIRRFIIPQLIYIIYNIYQIAIRIINNFVKDQKLQKAYIQVPLRNGGLKIPWIEKEMHAYKTRYVAYFLQITEDKNIIIEFHQLRNNKMRKFISFSILLVLFL
jgi:hypothetical protein